MFLSKYIQLYLFIHYLETIYPERSGLFDSIQIMTDHKDNSKIYLAQEIHEGFMNLIPTLNNELENQFSHHWRKTEK